MNSEVIIILLNWNGLQDTLECLESLRKINYPNYKVLVVDNNSSGHDSEVIRKKYEGYVLKIIANKDNLGFAGGNNVGIEAALEVGSDYILLLNNDTIVEPDFLSKLIQKAESPNKPGIISPMIAYYSQPDKIWSAGGYISKIKASGFTNHFGEKTNSVISDEYCTFVSGCCMLIRREVVEKIGLLNENYFLYLEDTDFCFRANEHGYKILSTADSKIYHKVSSTTSKSNQSLPLYFSLRNRLYFAKNNLGYYYYLAVIYLMIIFVLKYIFVLKFDRSAGQAIVNSFKDFLSGNMGKGSMQHIIG